MTGRGALVAAVLGAGLALAGPAAADLAGLRGLTRVALELELAPDVAALEDALRRRLDAGLGAGAPAPDANSPNRLRLAVRVRAHGASALRGFWLPFSGRYAIGAVALSVLRPVTLAPPVPAAGPLTAVVWHAERSLAGPWRAVERDVLDAVDELLIQLLDDYRRSRAP